MNGLTMSLRLMAGHVGELLTKYLFPDDAKGFSPEPRPSQSPRGADASAGPHRDR